MKSPPNRSQPNPDYQPAKPLFMFIELKPDKEKLREALKKDLKRRTVRVKSTLP